MRAGDYIRSQIESCQDAARHYRAEADVLRHRAHELYCLATKEDRAAQRWAAGTDVKLSPSPLGFWSL